MQPTNGVVKSIQSERKSQIARDMQIRREQTWKGMVPNRYARYTLQSHPDARARKIAGQWISGEEWREEVGRNLVISGPVGTGKTGIGIGILRHVHFLGVDVMYANVTDILGTMASTRWSHKGSQMAEYHEVSLLLLDDLGAEHVKDWTAAMLYEVIEGRYRNGAPTIITTNKSKKEMRELVGDRIVSRVFDDAVVLDLGGDDRRNGGLHRGETSVIISGTSVRE